MKTGKGLSLIAAIVLTMLGSTSARDADRQPTLTLEDVRWYEGPNERTANHELFKASSLTYASDTDPFNTTATVFWHGRCVSVRCNDRGPNHIELTKGAFSLLDNTDTGVLRDAYVNKEYPTNAIHDIAQAYDHRSAPDRARE